MRRLFLGASCGLRVKSVATTNLSDIERAISTNTNLMISVVNTKMGFINVNLKNIGRTQNLELRKTS